MYAIVEIAGQQFKVEKDRKVYVHRLAAEEGAQIEFDSVLLVDNDGQVKIGTPKVEGAKVTAKVLSHLKGDKVIIFKKRSGLRQIIDQLFKTFERKNGHRQYLTQIQIESINA